MQLYILWQRQLIDYCGFLLVSRKNLNLALKVVLKPETKTYNEENNLTIINKLLEVFHLDANVAALDRKITVHHVTSLFVFAFLKHSYNGKIQEVKNHYCHIYM